MGKLAGAAAAAVADSYIERVTLWFREAEYQAPTDMEIRQFILSFSEEQDWHRLPAKYSEYVYLAQHLWVERLDRGLVWTRVSPIGRVFFEDQFVTTAMDVSERHTILAEAGLSSLAYAYPFAMADRRFVLVPYLAEERAKDLQSGLLQQSDLDDIRAHRAARLRKGTCNLTLDVSIAVRDGLVHTQSSDFGTIIGGYLDQRQSLH